MILNKSDEIEVIYKNANSMYENKEYEEALNLYLDILKSDFDFFCRKGCIKKVQFCFRYLNSQREYIEDTLVQCSDRSSLYISSIRENINSASFNGYKNTNNYSDIVNDFRQVLLLDFDDVKIVDIWLSAFVCLVESINCNVVVNCKNDIISSNSNSIENTIIFASGMGYSGSGAIVAYLSEFNEIETSGNFELRHFQKGYGFINIIDHINSKNEFILSIFDFFFNHLLGDFPFVSLDVIRNIRDVRKFRKNFGMDYAKSVYDIAFTLSSLIKMYKDDIQTKQYILSTTVYTIADFLRSILSNKQAKYFVFNNCIFAENFHIFNYLYNVNIFCSIRDPRSNYVAQKLERPGVTKKIKNFIKYYKKMITSIDAICSTLPTNSHLYKVQFEHFVLKENYRKYQVLDKISPNLTHNNKYSEFKPFESFFNLLNYIQYDNAEEIYLLNSELAEYCINIDRDIIMNVLYDCVMENERLSSIINQKEGKSKPSESNFGLRKYDRFSDNI